MEAIKRFYEKLAEARERKALERVLREPAERQARQAEIERLKKELEKEEQLAELEKLRKRLAEIRKARRPKVPSFLGTLGEYGHRLWTEKPPKVFGVGIKPVKPPSGLVGIKPIKLKSPLISLFAPKKRRR